MKVLITGANGLLGQKLVALFESLQIDYLATSSHQNRNPECPGARFCAMDITNQEQVLPVIEDFKPDIIVNTAAMTNVDLCEEQPKACARINVEAVRFLWSICKGHQIHLVHYSTDFVFDGSKGNYAEGDDVYPLSVYGKSKRESEEILINDSDDNFTIVRTIIVYGTGNNLSRNNIFLWAKEQLNKGTTLTIVDDQFRAPTYAKDLSLATYNIIQNKINGIIHISGPETLSMYTIVSRLAQWLNIDPNRVAPISSEQLNQKAPRPPKTGFDLTLAKEKIDYEPRNLETTFEDMWG